MKKWSRFFQNEEYLEKTRMYILNEDMRGYVTEKIGLTVGMKVLDVGCGTGEFTRYLARQTNGISYTGLDNDPDFIAAAKKRSQGAENGNSFEFVTGDAAAMPFEDGCFDVVVSHTFFNSMPLYRKALQEMKRVCRDGGIIASMTATDIEHIPLSHGIYPRDSEYWKKDYDVLLNKVVAMYEKVVPMNDYLQGIPTAYIPNLFEEEKLRSVSAYPVGRFFSLSNSAVPAEKKRRFIELEYISDRKRLECVYEEDEAKAFMTEEEIQAFYALLEKKRDYLLRHLEDNRIWQWEGGTSLLITGQKASADEEFMSAIMNMIK